MSKWRSVEDELPPLPDMIFVVPPEPPDDREEVDRRRTWRRKVFGWTGDDESPTTTYPECTVTVLPTGDEIVLVFNAPVSIRETCDNVARAAATIARWPAVSRVYMTEIRNGTGELERAFASHGVVCVPTPPELESVHLYHGEGQWFLSGDHRGWASVELPFGDDVSSLVDAVRRLDLGDRVVEVSAKQARRAKVTPLLDECGIRWRADKARDFDRFDGDRVKHAGMSMRMSIENYGWMRLRWSVGDEKHKLAVTVNNDGWGHLATATRMAVCDGQPVYCLLSREDLGMLALFVPEQDADEVRIELWFTEDGDWWGEPESARGDDLRAHWTGPGRALASVVVEASRSLIATAGWDGVQDLWGEDAPFAELDRIESWLRRNS